MISSAAAIANAVYNAVGARIRELGANAGEDAGGVAETAQ